MSYYKDFPDEVSAIIYRDALNAEKPDWWCPIAKQDCNPRCYSFTEATLRKYNIKTAPHRVNKPHCSNAAMIGTE